MKLFRTNYLGELSLEFENKEVVVSGFVNKNRDLGDLIFIDLRDITGISQIVINSDYSGFESIKSIKKESVISVKGILVKRSDINKDMKTGSVEIIAQQIEVINHSAPTPIDIVDDLKASEDTRLKYRYLDLRRNLMQEKIILRHKVTSSIREFLNENKFIDIETPILTASTPEGARDYLVPSRVNKGEFYALPQSPQIYKNLLMISGFERYYQIVKCFRDEDLRADRQPEFTQVDLEMSFMNEEQIRDMSEMMIKKVVKDVKNISIDSKFEVMDYMDAMNLYGVDKPDIRFDLKINDCTEIFSNSEFGVFKNAEYVRCLVLEEGSSYSRKEIDKLEAIAKKHHAKGMAWLKYDEEFAGPIAKFLSQDEFDSLSKLCRPKSLILFIADCFEVVCSSLGALRNHLGEVHCMYNKEQLGFLWVVNWPMFEYDSELDRYFAMHHPFTYPVDGKFCDNPIETKACAYDLVLNGFELGGGSIRINNSELLNEMFNLLSLEQSEIDEKFGFLIDAYKYGAPYHGGIAFGLDRLCMLLSNSESIRDVIAFPKNNQARELMIDSPSKVSTEQLSELMIKVADEKN